MSTRLSHIKLLIMGAKAKMNLWFVLGVAIFCTGIVLELYLLISDWLDLSSKAALGDAINGLTAPLIGIFGAGLIYISFKEQVRTNRFHFDSLHQQREWDLIYRLYEELKSDLRDLQPYYGARYGQNDILDAFMLHVINNDQISSPYPDLSKYLDYIFKQFSFLSMRICQNEILTNSEKVHLIEKTRQLFNLYFESYYAKIVNSEWTALFSISFRQNFEYGGKAIINLNAVSIKILKERHQNSIKKN